ncbi:hypothetical protein [Streptomyces sp. NPDC048172]
MMLLLAELLSNFRPDEIRTRGAYVWSALLMMVLAVLVTAPVAHFYGQP